MNDVQRAQAMLKILRQKKTIDVYDIMLQFNISYSRAMPVMGLLKRICSETDECYYDDKAHKVIYIEPQATEEEERVEEEVVQDTQTKPQQTKEEEIPEVDAILNAQAIPFEETDQGYIRSQKKKGATP